MEASSAGTGSLIDWTAQEKQEHVIFTVYIFSSLYSMKQLHLYRGSKALKKSCVAVPYLYILITQE